MSLAMLDAHLYNDIPLIRPNWLSSHAKYYGGRQDSDTNSDTREQEGGTGQRETSEQNIDAHSCDAGGPSSSDPQSQGARADVPYYPIYVESVHSQLTPGDGGYDPIRVLADLSQFQFHTLRKHFVKDTYSSNVQRQKKLRDILGGNDNSNIFEAVWDMEEAQEILLPERLIPQQIYQSKDNGAAIAYLLMGEQALRKNHIEVALQFYNASIIFAPHPPLEINGQTYVPPHPLYRLRIPLGRKSWGKYEILGRARMARGEVLFKMNQFQACMEDIEFVLQLGCPEELIQTILTHMGLDTLEQLMTACDEKDKPTMFRFTSTPPPECTNRNPKMTSASDAVKLSILGDCRRELITTRKVSQGEVLIVEKSYCNALQPKFRRKFCMTCLRRTAVPVPCPSCTQVVFCSVKCRDEALLDFHWSECPVLPQIYGLNIDIRGILACRILFKTTFQKLKAMREQILDEQRKCECLRGLTRDGALLSDDYLAVYSMIGKKPHSRTMKMERAVEAFVLLKLMISSNRFFKHANGVPYQPTREEKIFVGSLLLHHLINLWGTADPYCEVEMMNASCWKNPTKVIAAGVFPVTNLAMTKGCCFSPCAPFTHGQYLVMRATRAIPHGTVLTCELTDHVWQAMGSGKDHHYVKDYFNSSTCPLLCDEDWGTQADYDLKCTVCPGTVYSMFCLHCHRMFDKFAPVQRGTLRLYTYDYEEVESAVTDVISAYYAARDNITGGVFTLHNLDIITTLIKVYERYIHLPNEMHTDAQACYILAMNHLTSSAEYDGTHTAGCTVS